MRREPVPGSPYWTTVDMRLTCANCGASIAPGERVLFFPSYRAVFCSDDKCGGEAAKELSAA